MEDPQRRHAVTTRWRVATLALPHEGSHIDKDRGRGSRPQEQPKSLPRSGRGRHRVVVTERGRPVARLSGIADEPTDKLAALIEAGLVRPPTSKVRQRPGPLPHPARSANWWPSNASDHLRRHLHAHQVAHRRGRHSGGRGSGTSPTPSSPSGSPTSRPAPPSLRPAASVASPPPCFAVQSRAWRCCGRSWSVVEVDEDLMRLAGGLAEVQLARLRRSASRRGAHRRRGRVQQRRSPPVRSSEFIGLPRR